MKIADKTLHFKCINLNCIWGLSFIRTGRSHHVDDTEMIRLRYAGAQLPSSLCPGRNQLRGIYCSRNCFKDSIAAPKDDQSSFLRASSAR